MQIHTEFKCKRYLL